MANIKFSQFTEQTDTANVQFLVGYNGSTNVRIAPGNVSSLGGSGTLNTIAMFTPDGNTLGNSLITISNIGTASESINSTAKILQVGPLTGTATFAQINLRSGAGNNGIIDAGLGSLLLRINSSSTAALELATTGALQAKSYGSGTFTGTAAYGLSVDSSGNIIETTGGAAYPFLIDTASLYSGFVPTGLSGNPQGNTTLGISAGLGLTTGNENTLIGTLAASSLTTQNDNVVIGNKALRDTNNSSSTDNVIIGSEAVMDSSGQIERAVVVGRDACRNVGTFVNGAIAIGYRAARDMGYGDSAVFIGNNAAANNTGSSYFTVVIGSTALQNGFSQSSVIIGNAAQAGTGNANKTITIGHQAQSNVSAEGSIAVGYRAGYTQTSGAGNTNIGYEAGYSNSTNGSITNIGYQAGKFHTGSLSTFLGYQAGLGVSSSSVGTQNTGVGRTALTALTSGAYNTALGSAAGNAITSGTSNVVIGRSSAGSLNTGSNNIVIGHNANVSSGSVDNEITLGDANITALRIPGLQSGASDGDVLTFASGTGLITLQAAGGGGASSLNGLSDCLIDTASEYVGTVPAGLSGNPQNNTTLGISAGLDLTTGTQNTLIGNLAGENVTAQFGTTAVGYKAGSSQNAESFNTYIGNEAGRDHTGSQSVFVGGGTRVFSSGQSSNGVVTVGYNAHDQKAGAYSVAVGYGAGNQASGGDGIYIGRDAGRVNTATGTMSIGYQAGYSNTSGVNNTNIGYQANYTNTTGARNVTLGYEAGRSNVGSDGVLIGYRAGYTVASSVNKNTMVGAYAGESVGSARFSNTFIGYASGRYYDSNLNCFIGSEAGRGNSGGSVTGFGNTAVGPGCFINSTLSSGVVAMGYQCLKNGTNTGDNIVAIGANIHTSDTITGSNLIILGQGASASSTSVSNEITLGDANITALRIPGLQSSASDGDVLTYASGTGLITLQAAGGGGNQFASGLYIGGTAAANLLEDYEKGTFTPTITSSVVTNGGLLPSNGVHKGYYERVGDFVTVSFELNFNGSPSAVTVDWTLTSLDNLPFTVRATDGGSSNNPAFITHNSTGAYRFDFGGFCQLSTTKIRFGEAGSITQTFSIGQAASAFVSGTVTYKVI